MNPIEKPLSYAGLAVTHLIFLLFARMISTDGVESQYGASIVPDIGNILGAVAIAYVGMHCIGYYFRRHHSDKFKNKYAYIFILLICSGLYADYGYRFLHRSFMESNARKTASAKLKNSSEKNKASHLTFAEYELIGRIAAKEQKPYCDISRFLPIQPQATDIEYIDEERPGDNWTTEYYFEVTYSLPINISVEGPYSSLVQQVDTLGDIKRIKIADGTRE